MDLVGAAAAAMTRVTVAPDSPFGPDTLPYGVCAPEGGAPRVCARLGEYVLDLAELLGDPEFAADSLHPFLARGPQRWREVRERLRDLADGALPDTAVHRLADVRTLLPIRIGDYVDFYASRDHATNVGLLLRPDSAPLPPNWRHLPLGYHGRSATVVVSGTPIRRPCGQLGIDSGTPEFGPTRRLDIEAELGFVVGVGSEFGTRISTGAFADHVFGVVLVDDWSARDIQAWEYRPLGPFLGKSFATSISAWVTPLAALDAARVALPEQIPPPLPYLRETEHWGFDIDLTVTWNGTVAARPPYRHMYWSPAQMLAHLTVNGAATATGDLFASGTVSGPERDQRGSLLELTWNGAEPVTLADGARRTFLADGDEVVITATAPGPGGARVGVGEVAGRILPALPHPDLADR